MRAALPRIVKGGEEIPDNTYGFEVEFCSHDNSVFVFTHVEVLTFEFGLDGEEGTKIWKIETDSGNVLEMVTDILVFDTVDHAYAAKAALAHFLSESIDSAPADKITYDFEEWIGELLATGELNNLIHQIYNRDVTSLDINHRTWQEVGAELTVENVDDGINIRAALGRYHRNPGDQWLPYVNRTIVSHSEKDWKDGFSSQMNMPMSLEGYYLYLISRKIPKSQARMDSILRHPEQDGVEDDKLRRNVATWFWRHILFDVSKMMMQEIYGKRKSEVEQLVADACNGTIGIPELKQLSLVYILIEKLLTGALGSLSEEYQLRLQEIAWEKFSTAAMESTGTNDYAITLLNYGIETVDWVEYHSSMKDLTGLWFKAALRDVLGAEERTPGQADMVDQFRNVAGAFIGTQQAADIWKNLFEHYIHFVENNRYLDRLWQVRSGYYDEMNIPSLTQLLQAIQNVSGNAATMLGRTQVGFQLPPADQREFLGYPHTGQVWEGRYDTMVAAIPVTEGDSDDPAWYKYLIEHRFN